MVLVPVDSAAWGRLTDINARDTHASMETSMTVVPPLPNRRRKANSKPSKTSAGDSALRHTGIHFMGDMPWGTHVCLFYGTAQDLLDTAACYFEAGLKSNELCVWAVSDPISLQQAEGALRRAILDFDRYQTAGQIELVAGSEWYLDGDDFDLQRITGGWRDKLNAALARGYDGVRASGNAFWIGTKHWKEFCEYEQELDRSLADQKMIVLCTYSLQASRIVDMLDVARAHQCSIVRRKGTWEFLETPELKRAKQEIRRLNGALDILSKPFPGHDTLTPRERVALAQLIRGASSKEAGRTLGISPRTVDFHRANLLKKLGARNTADLVHKVLIE
jgi:DNA-binding CsgD family transcriptional regulator